WRRNSRHFADSVLPLPKCLSRSGNNVTRAAQTEYLLENRLVRHLLHEQRNILEHVAVVQAESTTQNVLACAGQIVSEPDARAEVLIVVMRKFADVRIGEWIVERDQFLVCTAVQDVRAADQVEVFIPTQTEIQGQPRRGFPIILEIQAELLSGHLEGRIAVGNSHSGNCTGCRKAIRVVLRVREDRAWIIREVDFQRRAELEISALNRIPKVVRPTLQSVVADGLGYIVLKLPLP